MNTNVFFVRHGAVENPSGKIYRPDAILSNEGTNQMAHLGEAFANQGIKIDIIVTSPLPRAIKSAETIREKFNIPPTVIPLDGLKATDTPGWYDLPASELDVAGEMDIWSKPERCAETMEQVDMRLERTCDEILRDYAGKNILIIGHLPELGLLQNRLETFGSPSRIASFPAKRGEAWHVGIDGEERIKPLGIVSPENTSVKGEIAK